MKMSWMTKATAATVASTFPSQNMGNGNGLKVSRYGVVLITRHERGNIKGGNNYYRVWSTFGGSCTNSFQEVFMQ